MSEPLPPTHNDPGKKKVTNLYAMFGVGLVLSLVPSTIVSIVALFFMVAVLVAGYGLRKKSEPESLAENHATYIIRTIWIGTGFSVISVSLAGIYMLSGIDYSAFQPCAETFAGQGAAAIQNPSYEAVWSASEPCFNNFINENFQLLTISALIAAVPILIYFGYRYGKGLSRAMKGYRMMDPKSWF